MKLIIESKPMAKARHRYVCRGPKVITFDPQNNEKLSTKWICSSQMRQKGLEMLPEGPIMMNVTNYTSIPESWSKKRQKEAQGMPCPVKPDIDNYLKFYFDALNGIAYPDDRFITQSWSEKIYSANPRVEIEIYPLGGMMIEEHALTVKSQITMQDVEILVKKAYRLGQQGRFISEVFCQRDEEECHIFFNVASLSQKIAG